MAAANGPIQLFNLNNEGDKYKILRNQIKNSKPSRATIRPCCKLI